MDYAILAAELELPAYAGLSDQQAADALNEQTIAIRHRMAIADIQAEALRNGAYIAIDTAATAATTPDPLRAICRAVVALVNARFDAINLDDPSAQQMFAVLRQSGVLSAQQAAEIDALADYTLPSRATVLGLGVVTEADIVTAREWQAAQEAEALRLAAFAALRERLITSYQVVLSWLLAQQEAGEAAPEWAMVVGRM